MRPPGWAVTTLGDFIPLAYGKSLPESARTPGPFPVIGSSGVVGSHSQALTSGATIVVGRKGNVGRAHLSRDRCWPIDTVYFCDCPGDADLRFHCYLIESLSLRGLDKSTAVPSLSRDDYNRVKIDIPPESEQRQIADELDRYLSRLDSVVVSLDRAQSKLKAYRASVLKAAIEGRLVPTEAERVRVEKRDYEPADVLLKRILAERRRKWEHNELEKLRSAGNEPTDDRWKSRYREPVRPDTSALPTLPTGWCWATVESLSTKVVDGVHKKPAYVETGIPFVTVRNLTAGPGISFERLNHISPSDHKDFSRRTNPEEGDILISKDGTLGVVRVIRTTKEFNIFVSVALIKPVDKGMSDYLEVALSAPQVQSQMVPKGSGLQHIHLEDLRADCLPIAPTAEQERIVRAVAEHLSIADRLAQDLPHVERRTDRLRQAILKWAFQGKLVDQHPNDEPADKLLERIRTERAASSPAQPRRGRVAKASV